MGFLQGKRALIVGLASNRSIAYGIAKAMYQQGAELAFTYQTDKLADRVAKFANEFGSNIVLPCDVAVDAQIEQVFADLGQQWDGLDILVHSVAYAPADQIQGDYVENVDREGFRIAHDISSFSLSALAKAALPMMKDRNGAIVTMSYLGALRAVSNYNVMGVAKASLEANMRYLASSLGPHGVRVNAVSAGPIRTLAASGIKGFKNILNYNEKITPLRKNVSTEDVGNATAFLCSDLAGGVTGDVLYVDAGYHIVGTPPADLLG